jgi:hypothetical protein
LPTGDLGYMLGLVFYYYTRKAYINSIILSKMLECQRTYGCNLTQPFLYYKKRADSAVRKEVAAAAFFSTQRFLLCHVDKIVNTNREETKNGRGPGYSIIRNFIDRRMV